MRLPYRTLLGIYLVVLCFGVFTPRPDLVTPGAKPIISGAHGGLPAVGHHILYLGGPLQWVGNFLMFIPLVLLLRKCWSRLTLQSIFIITLLTTIFIELIQIYIPGRISDIRDIIANGSGAALTLLYLHFRKTSKSPSL
jgi:VanZ like family